MTGYVDIHAHVLPGIDDGPHDLAEALEMARAAAASGVEMIAATPHLRSDFPAVHAEELARRCGSLRGAIAQDGTSLRIVSGAEVSLTWAAAASDEELALASYGQAGADLLIETPTSNAVGVEPVGAHLAANGYRVTLAHPERCVAYQRDHDRLRSLVEGGLLLAVNAESILGPRAAPPCRLARFLVAEGLAHAIASDGHRASDWRPVTVLAEAIETAAALAGSERAAWMTRDAPLAIIEGRPLPPAPPIEHQRKRFRLFG